MPELNSMLFEHHGSLAEPTRLHPGTDSERCLGAW